MKKIFSIMMLLALSWCPLVQTMDRQKELEKFKKLQLFQQLFQHKHEKNNRFNETQKVDTRYLKEQFDYDSLYLQNMQIPMLHEPKNTEVQESGSWSFNSINPLNLIRYFWNTKSVKNFDWENPYTIEYNHIEHMRFYGGDKNLIEVGDKELRLYEVGARSLVFKTQRTHNTIPSTTDNNSCFYAYCEDEKGFQVDIYDAQENKLFRRFTEKLSDRVRAFGSDDLRFFATLSDKDGNYIEITPIRSRVQSKKISLSGSSVEWYGLFENCLVVCYGNEKEHRALFYDVKSDYRVLQEISSVSGIEVIFSLFHIREERIALKVGETLNIYSTKGALLYKAKSLVTHPIIDWDTKNFSRFIAVSRRAQDNRVSEFHDIDHGKVIELPHDGEIRLIPYKGFGNTYFYTYVIDFNNNKSFNVIYNVCDGTCVKSFDRKIYKPGFTGKDKNIFFNCNNENFLVYDVDQDRTLISLEHDGLEMFPRNEHLFAMRVDGKTLYLCNVDTLREQKRTYEDEISSVAFGPEDRHIAIAFTKKIDIFDELVKDPLHTIKTEGSPTNLGYSPDGRWLVVSSYEEPKSLWVYDTLNNYEVKKLDFKYDLKRRDAQWRYGAVEFDDKSSVMCVPTEGEVVIFTVKELSGK